MGSIESMRPMSLENLLRTLPTKQIAKDWHYVPHPAYSSNPCGETARLTDGVDIEEENWCADDGGKHGIVQLLG